MKTITNRQSQEIMDASIAFFDSYVELNDTVNQMVGDGAFGFHKWVAGLTSRLGTQPKPSPLASFCYSLLECRKARNILAHHPMEATYSVFDYEIMRCFVESALELVKANPSVVLSDYQLSKKLLTPDQESATDISDESTAN